MTTTLIETITDYEEALDELSELLERVPAPGSQAARRVAELTAALEEYEARRLPPDDE